MDFANRGAQQEEAKRVAYEFVLSETGLAAKNITAVRYGRTLSITPVAA